MNPKTLGLTLLGALQKRRDAPCRDYCPFGTMTIDIAPTEIVIEQPIRLTGYFPANGPVTLAPNVVATVTGAPGVVDTVVTFDRTKYETNTITVCPKQPNRTVTPTTTRMPSTTPRSDTTTRMPSTTPRRNTTTPTSPSCVPTPTGPPKSVCVTGLPRACTELGSLNGLEIVPALVGCTVALGPFAVGDTLTCLATSSISVTTVGTTIVTCLRDSLKGQCITELPGSCTRLRTETGLALIPDVAKCLVSLGPFAVGTALSCLSTSQITTTSTGVGIIDCLETALGLRSSTSSRGNSPSCTAPTRPGPSCAVKLPPECTNLRLKDGLALVVEVPLCVVALGVFGVGNAAQCLATSAITLSTTGVSIVECLEDAFKAQCPKELPKECTNIADDNLGELVVDIPLCTVALGPFAAGAALSCLSTSIGSGQKIVTCLKDALDIKG
ncbi:hypothetical protein MY11210_008069 [Beauveria gryllotalpidicola]